MADLFARGNFGIPAAPTNRVSAPAAPAAPAPAAPPEISDEQALAEASTIIPGIPDVFIFGKYLAESPGTQGWTEEEKIANLRAALTGGKFEGTRSGVKPYQFTPENVKATIAMVTKAWQNLDEGTKSRYVEGARSKNPFDPVTQAGEYKGHATRSANEGADAADDAARNQFLGTDVARVDGLIEDALAGDEAALAALEAELGKIKDPELYEYLGDVVSRASEAHADQAAIDAQYADLAKYEKLSDPTITAEEKLMMELSRRQTEQDLRGQREAIASNMQQRGVYGSGSELTQNAMSQQEAASRQALEFLGAQKNAQTRAMDALAKHTDLAGSIRTSSMDENERRALNAEAVDQWNKNFRKNYEEWKVNEQRKNNMGMREDALGRFSRATTQNWAPVDPNKGGLSLSLKDPARKGGALEGNATSLNRELGTIDAEFDPMYVKDKEGELKG